MAYRGFTIADMLDLRGVTLNIPPTKVKDQLTPSELTTTRRIANLRIHVERAIGRIKLLGNIPNVMARMADQIFFFFFFLFVPCLQILTLLYVANLLLMVVYTLY